jgi:long-chain fatty acid transport protein
MRTAKSCIRLLVPVACSGMAALLLPSLAASQGFGLNEVGTCAISRGFAATGTPCNDASTIFWNPAAAAELPGTSLSFSGSAIMVKGSFSQDSTGRRYPSNITPAAPPALFASRQVGRGSVGIGIYVPYGLTSQWNDDFPGRFSALRAALQTIYIQPSFAYRLTENWSIGGGPIFGHSSVDLTQAVDLSQQGAVRGITFGQLGIAAQTEFARAHFHGTSTAMGYNVAIHGKYGPWSIGARYLSALTFRYSGADVSFTQTPTGLTLPQGNPVSPTGAAVPMDAFLASQFSPGGALVDQHGQSTITHPWQLQGGIGYAGLAGTKLSADVARIGWSAFDVLPIAFDGPAAASSRVLLENYHDSWSYRFGAEHRIMAWTGRIGYSYAETPAPDETVTPLLPDMNRSNFSAGLGIPLGGIYRLDVGYLHVDTPGRRGRIAENLAPPPTSLLAATSAPIPLPNTGSYSLKADVVSAALNITF